MTVSIQNVQVGSTIGTVAEVSILELAAPPGDTNASVWMQGTIARRGTTGQWGGGKEGDIFGGDCSAGTTQGREKEATKLPGEAPPGILPGTWRVR